MREPGRQGRGILFRRMAEYDASLIADFRMQPPAWRSALPVNASGEFASPRFRSSRQKKLTSACKRIGGLPEHRARKGSPIHRLLKILRQPMRMLVHVQFPLEPFNSAVRNGTAGEKIRNILESIKPEAVYFFGTQRSAWRNARRRRQRRVGGPCTGRAVVPHVQRGGRVSDY